MNFFSLILIQLFLYNIQYIYDQIIFTKLPLMFKFLLNAGTHTHQYYHYGYLPYILGLISSIIWPLAWIYSNQHNIPMSQTTMIRGITTIIANYLVCTFGNCPLTFSDKKTFRILVFRGIVFTLCSLFIGISQFILPLNITHVIIGSSTLFVFVIDYVVNKVSINLKQGVGITIGLIGTVLASNGRALAQWVDQTYQQKSQFKYITEDLKIITLFTIFFTAIIGLWSYGFVLTKSLNYNAFQVNYFQGIFFLLIGAILYQIMPINPIQNSDQLLPKAEDFYWAILYTGIPLVIDQCFLILALLMCKQSGTITMLSYNSIIVSYLVSIFRYKQTPNMFVNVGVTLLAIGLYQTIFNTKKDLSQQNYQNEDSSSNGQGNEDPALQIKKKRQKVHNQKLSSKINGEDKACRSNQKTEKMSKIEKEKFQCRMPSD